MGIFRVFTSRPESVTRTDLCFAGPCYIAGFCPTGEDSLYAYLVEPKQDRSDMLPEDRLAHMRQLAEAYHGPWDDIRELMTDPSTVHYTLFEKMLLERPWWRGRVALIGDAAHTCPPTVAQGAAQAMEDALVMAESLLAHDDVETALDAFMDRRYDRAKIGRRGVGADRSMDDRRRPRRQHPRPDDADPRRALRARVTRPHRYRPTTPVRGRHDRTTDHPPPPRRPGRARLRAPSATSTSTCGGSPRSPRMASCRTSRPRARPSRSSSGSARATTSAST